MILSLVYFNGKRDSVSWLNCLHCWDSKTTFGFIHQCLVMWFNTTIYSTDSTSVFHTFKNTWVGPCDFLWGGMCNDLCIVSKLVISKWPIVQVGHIESLKRDDTHRIRSLSDRFSIALQSASSRTLIHLVSSCKFSWHMRSHVEHLTRNSLGNHVRSRVSKAYISLASG